MKKRFISLCIACAMCCMFVQYSYAKSVTSVNDLDESEWITYTTYNGNIYALSQDKLKWKDAEEYCEERGGHLVTITSESEQSAVEKLLDSCNDDEVAIGLHRDIDNFKTWVTGEKVEYDNWGEGEPDDAYGGQETGVMVNFDADTNSNVGHYSLNKYQWDDNGDGNRRFICEWDENIEFETTDITTFTKEDDGWSLANYGATFGYPDDYRIPVSRYVKVFGVSLSSVVLGALSKLPEWNGSCFGLSLLSIAQYNNQINIKDYFPSSTSSDLYDFGYNQIETATYKDDGRTGEIFTISGNEDAIELIECAQISQKSEELKKAKVFEGDSTYQGLLNYLQQDDAKPLLVNLDIGHTVVIRTDEKPEELENSPGWWYIPLYDCNQPANSDKLNDPIWFYTQEDAFLVVNPSNGDWQYWRNGEREGYGGYYFLWNETICFYDVSKLGKSFFTDALSLWGNIIKLDFSGDNIEITNTEGESLFSVVNGEIEYISEACTYEPLYDSADDTVSGSINIDDPEIIITLENGEVMAWSEASILSYSTTGKNVITYDCQDTNIESDTISSGTISMALQDKTNEDFNALKIDGETSTNDSMTLTINNGTIKTETNNNNTYEAEIETNSASQDLGEITLSDLNNTSFDLSDSETTTTSFDSKVSTWAKEEIEDAYNEDLVPDVLIGEDLTQQVDRAEFAAIAVSLYENLSGETAKTTQSKFIDISGNVCREDILKAYNLNITNGTSEYMYEPDEMITREQLATMLTRAYKRSEFDGWTLSNDSDYTLNYMGVKKFEDDNEISDYAKESVYFMVKWGVINGVGDNKFAPHGTTTLGESYGFATREEALVIALRSVKYL